jgi:Carboxypeptidase regulatory-like domain
VRRLPPYMIIAVCGILFLSAGMVIITADTTDPAAQPTATVEIQIPTQVVNESVDQVVPQPTDVPVEPVIPPTEGVAASVVVPTDGVQPVPNSAGDVVVTPVIEQPTAPLGTLPPPVNNVPTAENPVLIPTLQPTSQILEILPPLMQVTGQIGAPLRTDYSGIVVLLTHPDGSAHQTTTDSAGNFTFANLTPGTYRIDATAGGYLSSQIMITLTQGQNVVLPSAMLVGGDTNLDNKIDLTDAALIAANFDGASIVAAADLNHDGLVDIRDLTTIGAYFGLSGPTQWQP